ncbi:MAG: hypothetical protein JWM85_3536 [Acidimicrobiaceae bacterium]|nr:hypothetical protein [Acidimicrobiaceae bacterium]
MALVLGASLLGATTSAAPRQSGTVFGVLEANPADLAADYMAGIRLATVSLCWSAWEPRPGVTDASYRAHEQVAVNAFRKAGFAIAVDIGLQCAPSWVLNIGQLMDQYGESSGTANFEFNAAVRSAAGHYMRQVVAALGPVEYYRVGLSAVGEVLYPEAPKNNWWAFDPNAQGIAHDLPKGTPPSPLPGWVPGTPTFRGAQLSQAQVARWYTWYLNASINATKWEISTYRASGYTGLLQLVMPGDGAEPYLYNARIAADLAEVPYDPVHTLNTGAVWNVVLDKLAKYRELVLDISSVGDGSGSPSNNGCSPLDSSVPIGSSAMIDWSDTRYLSYLARRHGLAVIGENPGNDPASALPAILRLVRSCNLGALQWAWDFQLQGSRYVSLAAYRAAIQG